MIHRYKVAGITCNDCCKLVEEKLNAIPLVRGAVVSLESSEALIETETYISIDTFQEVLPSQYIIIKIDDSEHAEVFLEKQEEQQLYPLFLILAYILVGAVLLNYSSWNTFEFMLDFIGVFFIVFSFFKLLDLKNFPKIFKTYDPLANTFSFYAYLYPFVELILGFMFLMRFKVLIALFVALVILGITTTGVIKALLNKKIIECDYFGTALKLPIMKATLIENSIVIIMVVIMLFEVN